MRKLSYIICVLLIFACNSENANNCFQKSGDVVEHEFVVEDFTKIWVNRDVELILTEGATQSVQVETGKNLLNDVTAVVVDGELVLTDNNSCNYVRDYGVTKFYVTAPNITEIRSSTQYEIRSNGVLTYPSLSIYSEDFNEPDTFLSGEFYLEVDNNSLRLVFNGLSNCFVSGKTNSMNLTFAAGTSRFEGRDLAAQNVVIWNRSSNDMVLNPIQSLRGKISGTGDVILVNTPPIVEVEQQYTGRLIYE
ncbi:lipoprotein [Tamlana sedimentorum]|uniref:Lipoprotein n=1 Tax=Neotamlana sedimentorum TaxID=1435349 RepID=A0A0D7WCB8_9FLAO|nr:head GIN domain-containing protein [Tamlana sedimentorum]KJD35397.1 lipoprotein [Tamlana sedimentorum]